MTPDITPKPHRFHDEWLVRLIAKLPDAPLEQIEKWRMEGMEYVSQALMDADILTFDMIASLIRNAYRIESVWLDRSRLDRAILSLVPENVARRHHVVAVKTDDTSVSLAMANPLDPQATQDVESVTGRQVVPLFCPPGQLHELELEQLDPDMLIYDLVRKFDVKQKVEVLERESGEARDGGEDTGKGEDGLVRAPIIRLVDAIIAQAVEMGASDVHIEHQEASSLVRYRVDGVLRNMMVLPRYVASGPVVSRIKIMAGMDVSIHFRPQDGRAKLRVGGDVVGLRVSTLPSQNGEKVVLRILDEKAIQIPMEALGFHPDTLERFRELLGREQGVVLVTGPTGSGKTTTLYAALRELASEEVNVITVEDPVEYRLAGITQVQVNDKQGLTFPATLRSVLRQDPDVILVGEIRDAETASIAMQAAQTGHRVLSTLHTNDAVSAVVRLADMGVEGFKVATALLGATAQRLVRRLCDNCALPASSDSLPGVVREALERLGYEPTLKTAVGCGQCRFTGYRGRLALIELLEVTDPVRTAIGGDATADEIRALALRDGALRRLDMDALWHLARGETSLEECEGFLEKRRLDELGRDEPPATVGAVAPEPEVAQETEVAPEPGPLPTDRSRILVAMGDPVLANLLAAEGFEVEVFTDGALALASVARSVPDGLVVGPGLESMTPDQVIQMLRTVMGQVDLPIVAVGKSTVHGDAAISDTLLPGMDRPTIAARVRAAIGRRHEWSDEAEVAAPPTPVNERARVRALHDTGLLDTEPEERFDRITRDAVEIFDVPMSTVSLVDTDRQWFKARQGVDDQETTRDISFCGHGINYTDGFVVRDARLDLRFAHNPLVEGGPKIRFYAGKPIRSPDGHQVGMMCVMDRVPRDFTRQEEDILGALRDQVEKEIWCGSAA